MLTELILFLLFIIFFIIGFIIIYKQVSLVKKGEFNNKDRLQCLIYGFVFSMGVMVVIAMAFIFAINTPEFWQGSVLTTPDISPLSLLIPFAFCLMYISLYPLIDFLFIALSSESDEGLTPFHKFIGNKIIHLSKSKIISVMMAIVLYLLFIIPPMLLSLAGLPFLVIWVSWLLAYPLMILTFYGSKGYVAGITNEFVHIPEIKRSSFLNFEDSKRGMNQFISNPKPYILFGLMLFVFVWAWISMIQTIIFFFSGSLAISTMTSYFVFVTLLFGIIGYFTRFWGRKIKYRGIDIYFAAYLMAAIGLNVLVNFLIVNIDKLSVTLNYSILTQDIIPNFTKFAWAAVIEEICMITFTSYYFLSKKNEFTKNLKYSKITEYGQTFDPIPQFNFIKHSDPVLRKHAESTLLMMFERIPLKSEISLNDWKFKDSLLDGLCDSNSNSRKISFEILTKLEKEVPNIVLPWIIESLESPNYDKSIPIAKSLIDADFALIKQIPINVIYNLVNDSEWRLKLLGLKILIRIAQKEKEVVRNFDLMKLLNDPNSAIQVELLNLLSESSLNIPIATFLDKLNHTNKEIRAAAIKNIKNIDVEKIDSEIINKIIPFMRDPTSSVRASIFEVISKMGNFRKFNIPISTIFEGLVDSDISVRNASVSALVKYYSEEPDSIDIDKIISKIDSENLKSLNSVLTLLGKLWDKNPEKILTTFLIFIKFDDFELKERISDIIVENYEKNPTLVLDRLIRTKDESKYISKGVISRTITKVAKQYPKEIIPRLINHLGSDDKDIKLNVIASLDGLIEDYMDKIDIKSIISLIRSENDKKIKKEVSQLILKISKINPLALQPVMTDLLRSITEQDTSIRIILTKSMLEISKQLPDLIPVRLTINFLSDEDSFIRETSVKILGYIGQKLSFATAEALVNKALVDKEWIVRDAAVSSLGKIFKAVDNKETIIEKLVSLLDDDKSWVRRSSMNVLSSIEGITETQIPFEKVSENLLNKDSKVREGAANLLKIYSFENIDRIFNNVISLLGDESRDVRNTTVDVMVKIIQEIGISKVLSKLLKSLSDEYSIQTQQSIAIILGRTIRYEDEKIKKRVISLLKIRCEMSQDPIICEMLTKLRES